MSTKASHPPISQFTVGERARICRIEGEQSLSRRLMGLGLRVGSEVELLHRRGGGVVVSCNGNRIALGASVSDQVLAEPLHEPAAA